MYDFDTLIDRNGTGACKWDRRTDREKQNGFVPMSVADMEFSVAPCVKEAVLAAAEKGLYGYTDPDARYFEAVQRWLRERHGFPADREWIAPLYGVVPALSIAIRALTQPGESVLALTPVYYPFRDMVEWNGRVFAESPLLYRENRWEIDFAGFEREAAKPETTCLLLCSPHNPVGRVWTKEELSRIAALCERFGVSVVSDEIHFDIVLKGEHTVFPSVSPWALEHCILLTAASKSFNLPGLQLANAVIANADLRKRFVDRLHADGYSNISHFGYAATIAAYERGADWLDALKAYLRGNYACLRAFFEEKYPSLTVTELEGTYLAWVDFRPLGLSPMDLEHLTRNEASLFLDEGRMFGPLGEGFERFNIALPRQELNNALTRLDAALRARGYGSEQA